MATGLYLGKQVDPKTGTLGARLELDPADLLTHGLIVGMTGSGKTGLAVVLVEELLRQRVPVIAIDPKGDLANLLLLFDKLDAASFEPWIDPDAARREGQDVARAAADAAAAWTKGLADWGLGPADVAALRAGHDAIVYTPGSSAGVPLDILQSLAAPAGSFEEAEEDLRDEIQSIVAGLLGLVRVDADPLQSPPAVFLANVIESAWRAGKSLSLESLIAAVAEPALDKIGALPLETAFPRKDRQALMLALNNLLAAPSFESWRQGDPLDIERMLRAPDGRPRLAIVSTAHLADEERLFVTALLLDKVKTWMRRQSGTTELRALVYMDEVFGYFPPHPANPPTKRPLLTLLKQARAQGVGVVLATQNPVDLDYKGLANMGTWLVGTLQTQQDRERLRGGLQGAGLEAAAIEKLLAGTKKRVFLLHDVHRPAPVLLSSRWAMSYLRGPLTRAEISRLMKTKAASATPAATSPAPAPVPAGPPLLPAPFRHLYLPKYGGEIAEPHVFVKFAVRYKGTDETVGTRAWPLAGATPADALEAEPIVVEESTVTADAPARLRYSDPPAWLTAAGAKAIEKALRDRLPDKLALTLFHDPVSDELSRPGETREAFAARLRVAGGGGTAALLRQKLEKTRGELQVREQEASGRKQQKWVAVGAAVVKTGLQVLLGGRRRVVTQGTVSSVESVFSKNRMENTAEARLAALQAQVADLEQKLAETSEIDPSRLTQETLLPMRGGVKLLRYDVVWVY
jgi:DNA helicase HerA-like ATPase